MVRAEFIGRNGSAGLQKGKKYRVRVKAEYDWWFVTVYFDYDNFGYAIPYRSFKTMTNNWRFL